MLIHSHIPGLEALGTRVPPAVNGVIIRRQKIAWNQTLMMTRTMMVMMMMMMMTMMMIVLSSAGKNCLESNAVQTGIIYSPRLTVAALQLNSQESPREQPQLLRLLLRASVDDRTVEIRGNLGGEKGKTGKKPKVLPG